MSPRKPRVRRPALRTRREAIRIADDLLQAGQLRARDDAKKGIRTHLLPRPALIAKLMGTATHSPFISQFGYGPITKPGSFRVTFGIVNPDPYAWFDDTLGLAVCWRTAGAIMDPADALVRADPAGIATVEIGTLNTTLTPSFFPVLLPVPATMPSGRTDYCYVLYSLNAFLAGVVLERGSVGFVIP